MPLMKVMVGLDQRDLPASLPEGMEWKAGDTKLVWDEDNEDQVAAIKKLFDDLLAKGHLAYSVKRDGEKGRVVREFDPAAEKLIIAPPMQGG